MASQLYMHYGSLAYIIFFRLLINEQIELFIALLNFDSGVWRVCIILSSLSKLWSWVFVCSHCRTFVSTLDQWLTSQRWLLSSFLLESSVSNYGWQIIVWALIKPHDGRTFIISLERGGKRCRFTATHTQSAHKPILLSFVRVKIDHYVLIFDLKAELAWPVHQAVLQFVAVNHGALLFRENALRDHVSVQLLGSHHFFMAVKMVLALSQVTPSDEWVLKVLGRWRRLLLLGRVLARPSELKDATLFLRPFVLLGATMSIHWCVSRLHPYSVSWRLRFVCEHCVSLNLIHGGRWLKPVLNFNYLVL